MRLHRHRDTRRASKARFGTRSRILARAAEDARTHPRRTPSIGSGTTKPELDLRFELCSGQIVNEFLNARAPLRQKTHGTRAAAEIR